MSDSFEQLGVPIFWALWYKSESPKYRARYNSPSSAMQNKFKYSVLKIMCDYDGCPGDMTLGLALHAMVRNCNAIKGFTHSVAFPSSSYFEGLKCSHPPHFAQYS